MEKIKLTSIPETIEQAVETLTEYYTEWLPLIKAMSEEDLKASSHINASRLIRESWHLWWYEGHHYETWPKERPKLMQYFNDLGIKHPDDMSSIIMTCFYRSARNEPLDIDGQVAL